jgi:hypothetical protein
MVVVMVGGGGSLSGVVWCGDAEDAAAETIRSALVLSPAAKMDDGMCSSSIGVNYLVSMIIITTGKIR